MKNDTIIKEISVNKEIQNLTEIVEIILNFIKKEHIEQLTSQRITFKVYLSSIEKFISEGYIIKPFNKFVTIVKIYPRPPIYSTLHNNYKMIEKEIYCLYIYLNHNQKKFLLNISEWYDCDFYIDSNKNISNIDPNFLNIFKQYKKLLENTIQKIYNDYTPTNSFKSNNICEHFCLQEEKCSMYLKNIIENPLIHTIKCKIKIINNDTLYAHYMDIWDTLSITKKYELKIKENLYS